MNGFRGLLRVAPRGSARPQAFTWRGANARLNTCRAISITAPRLGGEASGASRDVPSSGGPPEYDGTGERQWSTPLARKLATAMEAMGPMPLARYMRMCLTSDSGGYYTRGDLPEGHDQFGLKGDFVTAPEISQVFGEMVGLWFVMQWLRQKEAVGSSIEIIETGPGRGTLMADMLRVRYFPGRPSDRPSDRPTEDGKMRVSMGEG
jgi:hypothetical protein